MYVSYEDLPIRLEALLEKETDLISNMANISALIYHSVDHLNWAGFYIYKENQLVLGPFQGRFACTRINMGKGVCGTAAMERKTILVDNVHNFPGHIACDEASKSEIVVPLIKEDGTLFGVLDIDSPVEGRFGEAEKNLFEKMAQIFLKYTKI
ncbi:GAF domain-containing protein [Parelusimicrobium proximum]|uniref:GAF domain-containing protein n=1 Tax=Parelusimicrobium proximum TaxID=3228953 RepID=UPI003D17A8E0